MLHDLRKVFRQVSNDLLRQFFEHEQCEMHVDWAKLTETRIESLFRAWTDLSDEQRQRTETVLEEIGEMAHIDALKVIVDEANKQAVGGALGTALEDRPSRADKAMLTYLQFPTVWDIAARFARTDMLARQRFWITRIGLPTRSPRTDSAAIDTFEKALSKHFVASEGRGHRCIVEFFPRTECLAYFFAYLDDFASMELHIDGHKGLARTPRRHLFETVFVFDHQSGSLSLYARGGKPVYVPLQRLFARAMLEHEVNEAGPEGHPYRLDLLLQRDFEMPTDAEDRINEVQVRRLKLVALGEPRRRLTLEADPDGAPRDIFAMIDRWLDREHLSHAKIAVSSATLSIRFSQGADDLPEALTFDVSFPNSSNLKGQREELRAFEEKYLKRWGIDVSP
jgi:hypothetical protein